jgi:hypothetical protein
MISKVNHWIFFRLGPSPETGVRPVCPRVIEIILGCVRKEGIRSVEPIFGDTVLPDCGGIDGFTKWLTDTPFGIFCFQLHAKPGGHCLEYLRVTIRRFNIYLNQSILRHEKISAVRTCWTFRLGL